MQRRSKHARVYRGQTLRKQRRGHAGKHIARSRLRQGRGSIRHAHDGFTVRYIGNRAFYHGSHAVSLRKQQRQLRRVVGRQGQRSGKARSFSRVRRDNRGQAVDEAAAQQQAAFGRGQRVKAAAVDKHRSGRALENGAGQLGGKRIGGIEAATDEERQRMTGRHGAKRFRARRRMHRTARSACAIRARPPVRACGRSLNRGRAASDAPPFIGIELRVRRQLIPRAHHKRRACRAHRRDGFGRAGNFGIPRAHALRGNRRKTCGAWIVGATGDQRQLAARILVRQVVRPRKQCRHLLQRILLRSLHPSSIRQALRTYARTQCTPTT